MVMLIPQLSRYIKPIVIFLVAIAVVMSLTTATSAATASVPLEVTVYRDPFCSCCEGWIDYLTNQGFQPTSVKTSTIDTLKQQYGVPDDLASCHTAIIDGYVVEGHVPSDDIKRLLAQKPSNIRGIAVPGMPVGTPGMEMGDKKDSYAVVSFDKKGQTKVFKQYSF